MHFLLDVDRERGKGTETTNITEPKRTVQDILMFVPSRSGPVNNMSKEPGIFCSTLLSTLTLPRADGASVMW